MSEYENLHARIAQLVERNTGLGRELDRLNGESASLRKDAERYRALRRADIDTIHNGGLFVGLVPENIVINGHDLDCRCDALISSPENPS